MQLILTYLIKPLLLDGASALFNWAKNKNKKRVLKKEIKIKLKVQKNAKTKQTQIDSFDDLP
tara:strand:+ start:20626 stop:20811 length:186 start_codon:yes stop_codon:yes gene_type:complete